MWRYENTTTGQVVESQERRPDLAGLARWTETRAEKPARKHSATK